MTAPASFETLPKDLYPIIFSNLDFKSLGRCCQVNKTWRHYATNDTLWKRLFVNLFKERPTLDETNIKKTLDRWVVTSENQVIKRLENLLKKKRSILSFSCYIQSSNTQLEYTIFTQFDKEDNPLSSLDFCIFTKEDRACTQDFKFYSIRNFQRPVLSGGQIMKNNDTENYRKMDSYTQSIAKKIFILLDSNQRKIKQEHFDYLKRKDDWIIWVVWLLGMTLLGATLWTQIPQIHK